MDDALGYLPENAPAAIAINTDLESGSFQDLDVALQRFGVQGGVEGALDNYLGSGDFSFANDIKPLLGNDLVIGLLPGSEENGPSYIASIQVKDGAKLEDLLKTFGLQKKDDVDGATVYGPETSSGSEEGQAPEVAIDGDTAVAAVSPSALKQALDQRGENDRLTETTFEDRLGDLPKDGIVRASGDLPSAIDALGIQQTSGVPWMAALRSFGISLDVSGRTLTADALVRTDQVDETQLPIAAGPASPPLVPHRSSLANLDQAQTIDFALDLVRASVPSATFDQIKRRLEQAAHGSLGALGNQFGQGQLVELSGEVTASRSEVRDVPAVRRTLATISGEVPQVARIASEGGQVGNALQAAHALIPALPFPDEGYFPQGSKVTPVAGHPDLYELAAPAPRLPQRLGVPGPPQPEAADTFFFGLIGDVFVTAPSLQEAQQTAALKPQDLATEPGSVAFSVPVRASDFGAEESAGNITLTVLKGGVEASPDGLRLRATAGL